VPKVTLHYFAIIREAVGTDVEEREVPEGTTAAALAADLGERVPRLAPLLRAVPVMVNAAYADRDAPLQEGDEIAFIPPVAGGTPENDGPGPGGGRVKSAPHAMPFFAVTADVLDAEAVAALVHAPDAGAVVTFVGTVRNHARGREVLSLDYEAYGAGCLPIFAQIADEARRQWAIGEGALAIHHRTGLLQVGEASVVIAVAAAHRGDAYAASAYAIDRLKELAPIWKKEAYADGDVWIGAESAYQSLPDRQ